jgi:tRNA dimethylallyltransferase
MKKVIVIVGPTASGKTKLSIDLAQKIGAEIINGDSVQIYRKLNIGSAKIKEDEKKGVKHHLFDVIEPSENYTVYRFQKDVRTLIQNIDVPMIVGGTGLYIKAALYDYEFEDEPKKNDYNNLYQDLTSEQIYDKLLNLDPDINIDINNRRRLIRALELAELGQFRSKKTNKDKLLYDACVIYLDLDRSVLEHRLKLRLEKQIEDGFIEEVMSLRKDHIHINAIGYREIDMYLDQKIDLNTMKSQIIKKSKQLAKKQKTWFKNQMQVHMIDALDENVSEKAYDIVTHFLQDKEVT